MPYTIIIKIIICIQYKITQSEVFLSLSSGDIDGVGFLGDYPCLHELPDHFFLLAKFQRTDPDHIGWALLLLEVVADEVL